MNKQRKHLKQVLNKQAQLGLLISAVFASTNIYAGAPTVGILPTDPTTISGTATYTYADLAAKKVNQIDQTSSKLITDWQSFSIGTGMTVDLKQNPGAAALFRVIGPTASNIQGVLNAHGGTLFLVNANGVLFQNGSSVNVGNFVASTMDINNNDFLNGNYQFTATLGKNSQYNNVINSGVINSKDGYIVLLGGNQVANAGKINADKSSVVLGAAKQATLVFDKSGLVTANLSGDALETLVQNTGQITSGAGFVQLAANGRSAAVNVSGLIGANTLTRGANGMVRLQATGPTGNVDITNTASIKLGNNVGFAAVASNNVGVGSEIQTAVNGDITITADSDKSGVGDVRLNASLRAVQGDIKIAGVNINDLPPTGAGVVKKSNKQQIITESNGSKTSGDVTITASNNIDLQKTEIATVGGTGRNGNRKGGDAGDIVIGAGGDAKLMDVISEGGNGVSNMLPPARPENVDSIPNGGNAGNIVIVAGKSVSANYVESLGGHAAGAPDYQFNPYNSEQQVVGPGPGSKLAFNGGQGGRGGNISISAGTDVNIADAVSMGGNGSIGQGLPTPPGCGVGCEEDVEQRTATISSNTPQIAPANGGNGGEVNISAGNDVNITYGAGSIGGMGGRGQQYDTRSAKVSDMPTAAGGNAGDVLVKAGKNVKLGGGLASIGGDGGANSHGGNAGNISVEAGGAVDAFALISAGGFSDWQGEASKGSDAGDVKVASTGAGDINIGMIAANSGNEVGSQFGKWGAGDAAKPGTVNVSNADGNINIAYIDTQGGINGDGGDVTIKGANDVTLGGEIPKEVYRLLRRQILIDSRGGINTNGGVASVFANIAGRQQFYFGGGTPGNDAGNIDVTANGNLVVGKITANGSDAAGIIPVFQSEEDANQYLAEFPKLNGGNGGTVTLRYGNTVAFIEPKEVIELSIGPISEDLIRPSLPIIKNPDPMHGPNGPIADVPEGQITANGGLPNYYGVFEFTEPDDAPIGDSVARYQPFTIDYRPLGNYGTPGQISILKLVDPVVIPPAVTIPTVNVASVPVIIPNARNDAGFGGFIANLPNVLAVNIENVGATAAGGGDGEECEASGSSNPNAATVLNFGSSLPGGVDPSC